MRSKFSKFVSGIYDNKSFSPESKSIWTLPITVIILGMSLSALSFSSVKKSELEQANEAFLEEVRGDIFSAIENTIRDAFTNLEFIAAFYDASEFVTRQEFTDFLRHKIDDPIIQALEWIPRVLNDERADYVSFARQDGLDDFEFTERQSQGDMITRRGQPEYFPVYYVVPTEGNEIALGFDLASNSSREEALILARDSGNLVASEPLTLVQEKGDQIGFIAFLPIYSNPTSTTTLEDRRANLKGFALGVFKIEGLIDTALENLSEENIHIVIWDVTEASEETIIYRKETQSIFFHPDVALETSVEANVGGRNWRLDFHATDDFAAEYQSSLANVTLIGGSLVTIGVAFYLLQIQRQNALLRIQESKLAEEIEKRTKKLNQALKDVEESERMKTEFLSTAAHELRTPLTSLRGFSEILLTRKLDKKRIKRFTTMIYDQAKHLSDIVEDLLDITKLETRRGIELNVEKLDMEDLINRVVDPFTESAPSHHFRVSTVEDFPPINGDVNRLAQVGRNIISNAIKYSPNGGEITVKVRIVPGYIILSVADEGIGMTKEQQSHLFEKFYRADTSNTSIGGTGLGLVISKLIVELHKGEIWVESEDGKGTTVFIKLPILIKDEER